jgi:hypothetical protein
MSNRVQKTKHRKTVEANHLLSAILRNDPSTMPSCSACRDEGHPSCQVSSSDSSRCTECVRQHRSGCDVLGISPAQLHNIATQHYRLEDELESSEEELLVLQRKILRLRKQKKLWFEKMMRAVRRGIDSVEELERVEREEAEREEARKNSGRPSSAEPLPDDFIVDWDAVYSEVPLSPSLLAEFGVLGGTSQVSSGSSQGVP